MGFQPLQIAIAQLRPTRPKGQELGIAQALLQGHGLGQGIELRTALRRRQQRRRLPRSLALMETAQDLVQPQAEGALTQVDLQLVAGLQAQLAQGKKPVGAVA